MIDLPATLAALGVAVLAVLPGAAYVFAFESRVGPLKTRAPDRIIRFLAASAAFHAVFAGLTYQLYRTQILTGRVADGTANPWLIELAAVLYVFLPSAIGFWVGSAYRRGSRWTRRLAGSWQPRSWDYVFTAKEVAYIRLKLKSGPWIGGLYAHVDGYLGAYASGYGEDQDLYLSPSVKVDPETGAFELDENDEPIPDGGSILVQWAEVEYAQFIP
jgi:hypothetical protein